MIPIHINTEKKFKTVIIALKFKAPINAETVTERSLLSKLMTKSTSKYPTEQRLYDYLSELYGAHLSSYVTKQKTAHVITFSIEFISERFINEPLFERACELLSEVIKAPNFDNGVFPAQKVAIEKQLLAARFDHMKDNKAQFSFQEMLQEMFKGHDYRFPSIGIEERLVDVSPASLQNAYLSMIESDEKALYINGDVDESVRPVLEKYFDFPQGNIQLDTLQLDKREKPVYITEHTETSQARINIGMTVPVTFGTPDYFAFILMNQIYGGDATSLLFLNVREKMSLAYQIHSQADARLGLMYVIAGVQNATYQETVNTILNQLAIIQQGEFNNDQLNTAKKMLISHRKENMDRPRGWIETSYASTFDDIKLSTEEWIHGIESVTKEQIVSIAKQVNVQTIYCLAEEVKA